MRAIYLIISQLLYAGYNPPLPGSLGITNVRVGAGARRNHAQRFAHTTRLKFSQPPLHLSIPQTKYPKIKAEAKTTVEPIPFRCDFYQGVLWVLRVLLRPKTLSLYQKNLWDIRGYGLSGIWVFDTAPIAHYLFVLVIKRTSTVYRTNRCDGGALRLKEWSVLTCNHMAQLFPPSHSLDVIACRSHQ